ncbi:MAG: hypothetical protein IT529_08865 [Burkholderiales bacterium]|nr:hypothetical protein [Burkholderiales bacterium]
MKQSRKLAAGVAAAMGLGFAVAAVAHPGRMGAGMGPQMQMKGGMQHGAQGGTQHGMMGGMGPSATRGGHGGPGPGAVQQLMTPEERTALQEKMRNARTPEERQKIAATTRTEMQKRAQEKGITLPEHRGPHGGFGPRTGAAPRAPATTEHQH